MTSIRRAVAAAGAATLLALSLTACGDDDKEGNAKDAPSDASQDEFCDAWNDAFNVLTSIEDAPSEDEWEEFQDKVEKMGDVGTSDDISDDNRKGFEVFVDVVTTSDYDDSADFGTGLPGASEDEQKKAESFITYAATTCASSLPTE